MRSSQLCHIKHAETWPIAQMEWNRRVQDFTICGRVSLCFKFGACVLFGCLIFETTTFAKAASVSKILQMASSICFSGSYNAIIIHFRLICNEQFCDLQSLLESRGKAVRAVHAAGEENIIPAGINLGGYCMMVMPKSLLLVFWISNKITRTTLAV